MARKIKRRVKKQSGNTEFSKASTGLPKVSDTLCAFAAPLLDSLPKSASVADREKYLLTAASVWNASIIGNIAETHSQLSESCGNDVDFMDLINRLIFRKEMLFGRDMRRIVDVRVHELPDGNIYVTADLDLK